MKSETNAQLMRIYVSESARWEGRPLYEGIVRAARDHGLSGATALRGIEGFGSNGRIHTVRVLHLSEHLPIVVEIVDQAKKIDSFLPKLDQLIGDGMVTIEDVRVYVYSGDPQPSPADDDELQLEAPAFDEVPEPVAVDMAFSNAAQQVLDTARGSASKSRRLFADSVDLLLALLCESKGIAPRAFTRVNIDCKIVEQTLRDLVNRDEPPDEYLKSIETKCVREAKWLGDNIVGSEHLLLAMCEIRPSAATDVITRLGTQPRDVCKEVLGLRGQDDEWQRWLADHPDM